MTIEQLNVTLLAGAAVLIVAIAAVRLAVGTGLPSLLLYVALGLALGESGLGIAFDDALLTENLGYCALIVILAEGGLTTPFSNIRGSVPAAAALAVVGTAVSVAVTAATAVVLLDVSWRYALLAGAVLASTDAAAVFSVLRRVPLPPRVAGLLEAESGFDDAPVVILVVALSAEALPSGWTLVALLVYELAVGAAIGLLVGRLGVLGLRRIALPSSGLYPLAVMTLVVGAYGVAATLHASGFLAVYLAALVLGNARLPHRAATRGFAEGLAWLAQIGLFVMLGLLASPAELPAAVLPALGIGLSLLLLARPLSVLVSLTPFRIPLREQAFVSWAGLRGAVPIVLATVPVVEGVPDSDLLFNIVFVLVVLLTLLQAPTLPLVARLLGVAAPAEPHDVDVESSPLVHIGADLLEVRISPESRLHGVELFELRLPPGAVVSLVVRDGRSFVPGPTTPLRRGDAVLVVAPSEVRDAVAERLRAVSRRGRLVGWHDAP